MSVLLQIKFVLSSSSCIESFVLTVVLRTSPKHFSSGLLHTFDRTCCYGDCFQLVCSISLTCDLLSGPRTMCCVSRDTCKSWILLRLAFRGTVVGLCLFLLYFESLCFWDPRLYWSGNWCFHKLLSSRVGRGTDGSYRLEKGQNSAVIPGKHVGVPPGSSSSFVSSS